MAGLLSKKPKPAPEEEMPADEAQAPTPDAMPEEEPSVPTEGEAMPEGEGEESSNVTPEEQQAYDQFVANAYKLIYSGGDEQNPRPNPAIVKSLSATDDPVQNLAQTAVIVVSGLQQSATQAQKQIPDEVLFQGGKEILEDLANLAKVAKIHDYTEEELDGSAYRAMDLYRQQGEANGTIDPENLKQQFQVIQEADKRGMLGKLMPGIDKGEPKKPMMNEEEDNGGPA